MNLPPKTARPIVIKYGGSLMEDAKHELAFLKNVAQLARQEKVVLVHGGGLEITRALEKAGIQTRFVEGFRFTDKDAMGVVERVLAEINARIVKILEGERTQAAGFCGKSENLMVASPLRELGRVGKPQVVNQTTLEKILQRTPLPVFYSVAGDSEGGSLNINADDFALALAVTCRAKRLVFLTDSGAILGTDQKPLTVLSPSEVDDLIERGIITGGMMVKARACVEAIRRGVGRVDICRGIEGLLFPGVPLVGTAFVHEPTEQN